MKKSTKRPLKKKQQPEIKKQVETSLLEFYRKFIQADFNQIQNFIKGSEKFQNDTQKNFDFLFKQFEDLKQEYIVANAQMKRLQTDQELNQEKLADFGTQLQKIRKRLDNLETQIISR